VKKKIFVCLPLRGDIEANKAKAKKFCREVCLLDNHNAFAPHVFYTEFLDEMNDEERKLGILLGLDWLYACNELWAFADVYEDCSTGMKMEIEFALKNRIKVCMVGKNGEKVFAKKEDIYEHWEI
jgi:hypothetical protein